MAKPKKQAPKARERYMGGTQFRIENVNPWINKSFAFIGYPELTDYEGVVANDGNLLYNPSVIAKGFDYLTRDSAAIEIPRHINTVKTSDPVYKHKNPKEFQRLSRRVDEAKSVSNPIKKQQGGQLNMDEQKLQQAFIQFLAQKYKLKSQKELEAKIQELGENGLKAEYAEFQKIITQQQSRKMMFGAKLNYIKGLKGQCPQGYEMKYYKKGGRVCTKCEEIQKQTPMNTIDSFKRNRKVKKKTCGGPVNKKQRGGNLPTAEPAQKRYANSRYYADPVDGWKYDNGPSMYAEGYVQNDVPFYENPARIWRVVSPGDTTYYEIPKAVKGVKRVPRRANNNNPKDKQEYQILQRRFNSIIPNREFGGYWFPKGGFTYGK